MPGDSPQQQFIDQLAALLRAWCGAVCVPEPQVTRLVEWAAMAATRGSAAAPLRAAAQQRGSEIAAEARSCLGELFSRQGADSELAIALSDVLCLDDAAVVAEFMAVVNRSVRQQLYKQWRTDDPAGFNLWRLLRSALHSDPRILIFPPGDPAWATAVRDAGLRSDGQTVTTAMVLGHILELSSRRLSVADLIVTVLGRLGDTPGLCRAVRIDVLFAALREAVGREAALELGWGEDAAPAEPQLRLAIEKSVQRARAHVAEITRRYVTDGKLDPVMAGVFERSASDLLHDYAATGIWPDCYPEYIQRHRAGDDNPSYAGTLKARFEYIAKVAKQMFERAMRVEYNSP